MQKKVHEETGCGDEIIYHINGRFDNMENVCVVSLKDRNKLTTHVFESGVYLLNNRGQTVQKIA